SGSAGSGLSRLRDLRSSVRQKAVGVGLALPSSVEAVRARSGDGKLSPYDSRNQLLQVLLFLPNVGHLPGTRNFPLNSKRSIVTEFLQARNKLGEIRLPLADGNFFAQLLRVSGKESIFGVGATHELADHVQRVERIPFAVKDQVGGVQVDELVVDSHVGDGPKQGYGGFLPCLIQHHLPV